MFTNKISNNNIFNLIFLPLLAVGYINASLEWTFPSDCKTDEERREYFVKIINQKARGMNTPNINYHVNSAVDGNNNDINTNFGYNFSCHGPIEDAYKIAGDLDSPDQNIIVLACGIGRNVIDFLLKTKGSKIIANDINKEQLDILRNTASLFNVQNRLKVIEGDCRTLNFDKKRNIFYIANLIHFFKVCEIDQLFQNIKNSSEPNSLVFLSWHGFNATTEYNKLKDVGESIYYYLYKNNQEQITKENNTRHSLGDITNIAKKYDMEVLYGLEYYKIDVGTEDRKVRCDYKFEPYDSSPKDFFPVCQMVIATR